MTDVLAVAPIIHSDRTVPGQVRRRRWLRTSATLAVLGVVLAAASFLLGGGRYFVVRTPSMGTEAPVGTLVLTRPVAFGDIRAGDVIAFHPPTSPDETYTHRVVAITPDGLRTRGDINGSADPWTLTGADVIGRAAVLVPGLGWLVRALPMLIIGGLIVGGVTRTFVRPVRRGPARLFGASLTFMVTAIVLRPFVGVVQLASANDPDGSSRVWAVSTGLLPIRLEATDGNGHATPVDLSSGEAGVSVLRGGVPGSQYHLTASLHLCTWQWLVAIGIAAAPTLWTLLVGFRPALPESDADRHVTA